jgi:hypothetical protein
MTPSISLDQIQKIEKQRKEIRKETYKKIYEQFNKKIKNGVVLGYKQVVLTVPAFILGLPAYNTSKAGDYLQRQFELSKFIVYRLSPTEIYVSWDTKKSTQSLPSRDIQEEEDVESLTSLINLKKMASKYKNAN